MKAPVDWKSTLLHHVAEVRSGLSKSAKRQGPTVKKPYLRVANVQDGFLDLSEIKEIDVPASQVARFTLRKGDILLIEGNGNPENLGRGSIWDGQIPECVHQNHVFSVRTLPEAEMLPEFMALQLQSDHGRNYLLSCAKGSTGLSTLNSAQLKEFPLLSPCLTEQRSIVVAIATWDTAIQKTEQLIAAKERHYSHELSRLISQRKHPHGHDGTLAKEASNGAGKWQTVALSEIADRVQRQNDGGDYPLLTISSASGFIRQEDRYSRYMAGESAKTYTLLRAGEFSYNKGNSKRYEFGCVFQLQNHESALVPSVYVSFKLHDSVCASYMRHLFAADYLKPQLRALVKTGVRNNGLLNIRPDEFMCTKVHLPPVEQQLRIANYLDAASAEIDLLKQQLAALRIQKRGLMQKLLTGQWRLPTPKHSKR
jgi:type I restriction enzyme S subunit